MRFSVLFPSAKQRISPIFFQGETDLPAESVRLVNSRCPQGGHNRQKLRFDGLAFFRRTAFPGRSERSRFASQRLGLLGSGALWRDGLESPSYFVLQSRIRNTRILIVL
jgi:hypothetical protein